MIMSDFVPLFGRGGFTPDVRFAGPGHAPAAAPAMPEPAEDPVARAFADGFEAGMAEAHAAAEAAAIEADASRAKFALSFKRLNAELAEGLRQKLHETVIALCEEALRPLALDHAALAARVERAVAMFTRADDERVIRLNPEDRDLVAALLPPDWTFLSDPALDRGALRVETANGGAEDGPEQWRRDIAEALRLC